MSLSVPSSSAAAKPDALLARIPCMNARTLLLMSLFVAGCRSTSASPGDDAGVRVTASAQKVGSDPGAAGEGTPLAAKPGHALAAFAAGCFWGVEDGFRKVPGVTATAVGYAGGRTARPTYEAVCDHGTGHAETVLIEFDPAVVSYEKLVRVFFAIHDPTQVNRQGPDVGDQYRSAIFTFSPEQAATVRAAIVAEEPKQGGKIATEVTGMGQFWKAEDYHQQYSEKTGHHGCPIRKISHVL